MSHLRNRPLPGSVEAWESPLSAALIADMVVSTCGLGRMLQLGATGGVLASALLRRSVDIVVVDGDSECIEQGNRAMPGRFTVGAASALPFADGAFDTVIACGYLERLDENEVPRALQEIRRVSVRDVFLQIRIRPTNGDASSTVHSRAWWEERCFAAGFRKHPRYYQVTPYEGVDADGEEILIVLEPSSTGGAPAFQAASDVIDATTPDMLRQTGVDSDAALIRYHWASTFLRPGDRVLDLAAGAGYGCHLLETLARNIHCVGISTNVEDARYAEKYYGRGDQVAYRVGVMPAALRDYADADIDAVVCFDRLAGSADLAGLLDECWRILSPGGRILACIGHPGGYQGTPGVHCASGLSAEAGCLLEQMKVRFEVEAIVAQYSGEHGCSEPRHERVTGRTRRLQQIAIDAIDDVSPDCLLIVAMKSPFVTESDSIAQARGGRVYASGATHPSALSYQNPWLVRSLFMIGQRVSSDSLRDKWAMRVMATAPQNSSDYAAALCVHAYVLLGRELPNVDAVEAALERIDSVIGGGNGDALWFRWQVSLSFVKAGLLAAVGRLRDAMHAYEYCSEQDVLRFGVHLATKTTQACYEAGRIAISFGERDKAAEYWTRGLELGRALLGVDMGDILIDRESPNLFNHGDGVREYTLAWDNVARCANGIHLLKAGRLIDANALAASFAGEYAVVTRDVKEAHRALAVQAEHLIEARADLIDRTAALDVVVRDLDGRTKELVETRERLAEHGARLALAEKELDVASQQMQAMNEEVVQLRGMLTDRTRRLEEAERLLQARIAMDPEINQLRELLMDRTRRLEEVEQLLQARIAMDPEIIELRELLVKRTGMLEEAEALLRERTALLESMQATPYGRPN
ncbi:hypothetical protein NB722_001130 [Xanthomonas sacchari]|uniref:class I SAM-dependent methyltransferase n=1 Tax=Xanthomonas sacchari TaxID=56458 RepID=UPI00225A7E90|nr:class I SAM-dependent methyltransferase [Xanthomonas sacchari]MCW0386591.1 hypothetical protein [Xanthomonas sacchari]